MDNAFLIVAILISPVIAFVLLWWKRRRKHKWLDAIATEWRLKRRGGETDEELRARMRSHLENIPLPGSRESILVVVQDALYEHGYPRVEVEFSEPGFGHVHAHVKAKIPVSLLHVIEDEAGALLPLTIRLELTADR